MGALRKLIDHIAVPKSALWREIPGISAEEIKDFLDDLEDEGGE